jgi:hypothetical protein
MPELRNADPDLRTLKVDFGLLLTDAFTKAPGWQGALRVGVRGMPETAPYLPITKREQGAFLFHELPAGNYTFQARSDPDTPYYEPVDFVVALPFGTPRWPVFPNIALADPTLPLDAPAQPAAYRMQRAQAALQPTTAYPFPADATLLRGMVTTGGNPLPAAAVVRNADKASVVTNKVGEYVLNFPIVAGLKQIFALTVSHPAHGAANFLVEIARESTVVADFILP